MSGFLEKQPFASCRRYDGETWVLGARGSSEIGRLTRLHRLAYADVTLANSEKPRRTALLRAQRGPCLLARLQVALGRMAVAVKEAATAWDTSKEDLGK